MKKSAELCDLFEGFLCIFTFNTANFSNMEAHNYNSKTKLPALISRYEAMSQKGAVGFFEKTVFFQLIEYYLKADHLQRAIEVVDHALAQHAYSARFHYIKAELLYRQGNIEAATQSAETASAFEPGEPDILLLKARLYSETGNMEDALVALEQLKQHRDSGLRVEVYSIEARLYERLGEFDRMFYALKEIVPIQPEKSGLLKQLWLSVELSELFDEAIAVYKQLIDYNPYNSTAWCNLGCAHYHLKNYQEAAEAFEYAYLIDLEYEFAYQECANCWLKTGQFEKALECYEEALEHIEPGSSFLMSIGQCYEQQQQFPVAQSFYSKAIERDPRRDDAFYRMGVCFMHQKKWLMASQAFEIAIDLNKRQEKYLAAMGETCYQMNDLSRADYYLRLATDTAPDLLYLWIQYASFLMETGYIQPAQEVLEEAAGFVSGGELEYCQIACHFYAGNRPRALYELREALDQHFDLHQTLFDLMPDLATDKEVQGLVKSYAALSTH